MPVSSTLRAPRIFLFIAFSAVAILHSAAAQSQAAALTAPHDGQHDFDFEVGTWKVHVERLDHALSGSHTWNSWDGTSHVRKVWDGRANLVELEADGPTGHIEFLSPRLYDPRSQQWSLNYASSSTGQLTTPSYGQFHNGRGEFYDQEIYEGRAVLVRGILTSAAPDTCRFEQSYSPDGGKMWEVNFTESFTRMKE